VTSHRLSAKGIAARTVVAVAIATAIGISPLLLEPFQANQASRAAIYAVIGLSLNILMGHAGQISLGHQAFVGVGAFTSGWAVSEAGLTFWLALPIAGVVGALSALLLGVVALRLRGLYLALITLAYGAVAEESIFNIRALTRGGAGMPAPRPGGFESDRAFLYICMVVLALVLLMDWRLVHSKAGRAIAAIRHDERVAATMGVNVTFYKVFAFTLSGFVAGLAGSLFAHRETVVVSVDFVFSVALTWVFMTVVGGLGSRAGVVAGSSLFAVFPFLFESFLPEAVAQNFIRAVPLIGAGLLVFTLILYPGGIGQQMLPLRRWLAGGPFLEHHKPKKPKKAKKEAPGASGRPTQAPPGPEPPGGGGGDPAATRPLPPAAEEPTIAIAEGGAASGALEEPTAELPALKAPKPRRGSRGKRRK
jgi:branched-chain amino acid transport system permease protein